MGEAKGVVGAGSPCGCGGGCRCRSGTLAAAHLRINCLTQALADSEVRRVDAERVGDVLAGELARRDEEIAELRRELEDAWRVGRRVEGLGAAGPEEGFGPVS